MIKQKEILLEIKNLYIDGFTGEQWVPIIKGVDLELRKGEVLGLIGESGAGKSTMGAAAMGYARDGTRISDGSINFSGIGFNFNTKPSVIILYPGQGSYSTSTDLSKVFGLSPKTADLVKPVA